MKLAAYCIHVRQSGRKRAALRMHAKRILDHANVIGES